MDKWKELELNKMKSGGNNKAKEFLEGQSDWKAGGNISANYNSKAAALYRDKVVIILLCLKVYWNVIYYAIRYLVRQKANPGVRRRLLLGITSLLISAPQAARLPARDQNKCQRRGEWGRVKHIMASLTVQSQLEVIRFDIWVGKDLDMLEHANLNCRGVPNQQGPSIKQKSSRQPKKISLTVNKPRTQWGEMTCLPLKEENMLDLEAVATLALLLAPFPPRTLPPAPLVASPILFQGSCNDPLRLSFNTMLLLQFGPECLWSGRQNGWSWLEVHKSSWAESCRTVRKCNRKGLLKK